MNSEFFEALAMLEKERGISEAELVKNLKKAIIHAVKKSYDVEDENVKVVIEPVTGEFSVAIVKDVVEEVEDPRAQMTLEEAQRFKKTAQVGAPVEIPLKPKEFGRIAAQTAKHVLRQDLRAAERGQMYTEMQGKAHEIINAVVMKVDPVRGSVVLDLGKSEAVLPHNEQVPGEVLREGERVKVYVVDVTVTDKDPKIMISRTHPGLVKRMFEMEVPEIADGTVEIKAISREAGMRAKMAVWSKDENVDPVGACIGARGARVASIVEELGDVPLLVGEPAGDKRKPDPAGGPGLLLRGGPGAGHRPVQSGGRGRPRS